MTHQGRIHDGAALRIPTGRYSRKILLFQRWRATVRPPRRLFLDEATKSSVEAQLGKAQELPMHVDSNYSDTNRVPVGGLYALIMKSVR